MATSGTFVSTVNYFSTLEIDWRTVSQDVAGNSSVVEAKLYYAWTAPVSSSSAKNATISINGSSGAYSFVIGSGSSGRRLIGTRTIAVAHNSDGTKSTAISGSASLNITLSGTYIGTVYVSGTAVLDTIPRASTITSASNVLVNGSNECAVVIDRKSGGFTHTVTWAIGAYSFTRTGIATTTAYAIPMEWLRSIPNSTYGSAIVTVTTFSGGTQIGNATSRAFTITVPGEVVPTISSVTDARVNNSVPAAWGVYVQNISGCTVTINGAAGTYGSWITAFQITGSGVNSAASSVTFGLSGSGQMTFVGKVTDSRGRTATGSVTITVQAWKSPEIASVDLKRALSNGTPNDDGTYGLSLVNFTYSSVAGKNPFVTKIEYRIRGASTWLDGGEFSNNVAKLFGGGGISLNNTYEIQISVSDYFSQTLWTGFLSTAFTTMDFKAGGKGIAFGKVSEKEGVFETAFPIELTGGMNYVQMPPLSDFNTYTKAGFYFNATNAEVELFPNRPSQYAGSLQVLQGAGVTQIWTEYSVSPGGQRTWKRGLYMGTWSAWFLFGEYPRAKVSIPLESGVSGHLIATITNNSVTIEGQTYFPSVPLNGSKILGILPANVPFHGRGVHVVGSAMSMGSGGGLQGWLATSKQVYIMNHSGGAVADANVYISYTY